MQEDTSKELEAKLFCRENPAWVESVKETARELVCTEGMSQEAVWDGLQKLASKRAEELECYSEYIPAYAKNNLLKAIESVKTVVAVQPAHPVGFLLTPKDIDSLPCLKMRGKQKLVSPAVIDLREWDLPPKDQGSMPMCAAYAAASYVENILWRKNCYPTEVKPAWIYKAAKQIDGYPNEDGTTLTAVLQAILDRGIFDKEYCKIKILRTPEQVKLAIHQYGTCLVGVMVTKEYYLCNEKKHSVCGEGEQTAMGGHALQCVGFNRDGFICRNSWGRKYGYDGNFIIAYPQFEKHFMHGATFDNPLYDIHIKN